jgi:hypothetical protein
MMLSRAAIAHGKPTPRPSSGSNSLAGATSSSVCGILNVRNVEFKYWVGWCSEDGTLSGREGRSGEI